MKEAANSLLKILEEPPGFATIFLLTENAGELLPPSAPVRQTSRSARYARQSWKPVSRQLRSDWNPRQRALVARLSEGAHRTRAFI